jgi:pyruvate formate lyase activating enzyme
VVFHEFARDVARACRTLGLRPLAVSAGYVCAEPRAELFEHLDAVTIELKALSESFYARFCAAHLEPVLDTLRHVRRRTSVWLEVTSPLVPGENDGDREIERLSGWIAGELGPDVPLHFSSFHPDGRMEDRPPPSPAALQRARYIALASGLRYVYVASPRDADGQATSCHGCGMRLIARDGDAITEWALGEDGACMRCGTPCAGVFEERPQHRLGACAPPAPREAAPA